MVFLAKGFVEVGGCVWVLPAEGCLVGVVGLDDVTVAAAAGVTAGGARATRGVAVSLE